MEKLPPLINKLINSTLNSEKVNCLKDHFKGKRSLQFFKAKRQVMEYQFPHLYISWLHLNPGGLFKWFYVSVLF